MIILLSNDDGFFAEGIAHLKNRLLVDGHRVIIVAPDRNRSACSSSITVRKSLSIKKVNEDVWSVENGSPADCVHLALGGLLDVTPDFLFSGINDCPNLGDDTLYSGTVAAILQGRHLVCPKIALSVSNESDYNIACEVGVDIMNFLLKNKRSNDMLNVNIPNTKNTELKGWKITTLGKRLKSLPIIKEDSKKNQSDDLQYYLGGVGEGNKSKEGTDFHAIAQGFISITPLSNDMTDFESVNQMKNLVTYQ